MESARTLTRFTFSIKKLSFVHLNLFSADIVFASTFKFKSSLVFPMSTFGVS